MLGVEWEESMKMSEINNCRGEEVVVERKSGWNHANGNDPYKKFSQLVSNFDEKGHNLKSKSKGKRKTKSKSKSQNKKSTLKTISALSAHSKNMEKI